jgi:hypothetical protein
MFVFPASTASDMVRNNVETQFSLFLNISRSLFNASEQLGRLNVQAGRKLMEESTDAVKKGVHLRTLADTQSFIAEQSQATVDRVRGYALNVQNIAVGNWIGLDQPPGVPVAEQSAQSENADDAAALKDAASDERHETDQRPSPLVEKLIASVANDVDKLH